MNIPVTVFMCICWSMFPLFWKIYSLKGSRLAPGSNLSRDIWTHACVDKIPQPDSAHQSKHIRWRLQKKWCVLHWRWAHMASTILMRTTAASTHPGAVLGMKLPCFHSSFLPQTKNRQMRASDLPLWSQCPKGCQPVRSVSSWPWWSRHDLDRIKGLETILFLSLLRLDSSTHVEEQMKHRSRVGARVYRNWKITLAQDGQRLEPFWASSSWKRTDPLLVLLLQDTHTTEVFLFKSLFL